MDTFGGKWASRVTLYPDKGTGMSMSQAFVSMFFHRMRSMLTSSALSAKEGLMGILHSHLSEGRGGGGGGKRQAEVKMGFR